jgi:predicted DCC family thiol-disulfide oxidoreductase YuxK
MAETTAPICVFDGHCVLCAGTMRFVLAHERVMAGLPRVRFCAIQSPAGGFLAARHGVDAQDPDTFLWIEGDRCWQKGEAVARLAGRLVMPWRFVGVLGRLPRRARDALYDLLAKNRYRLFGREAVCLTRLAVAPDRFVVERDDLLPR